MQVRFGGRTRETHQLKGWQGALARPYILSKIRKIYPEKRILLLWDGAGWHRGSVAQEAIRKHQIEAIHFPPYSPQLNPQEHVWKQGRTQVTHNRFIPKIEPVTKELVNYLNVTTFPYSLLDFTEHLRL